MIYILIPLYNDWEALALLLRRFDETVEPSLRQRMRFAVINDCSSVEPAPGQFSAWPLEVIHLNRNVGHQKAIALGLAFLTKEREFEAVIVMDSDGEDRPEDTATLYAASQRQPDKIVFAHRTKRHESLSFRAGYVLYKAIFGFLTGKNITFGNFSIVPYKLARKLAYVSEIWNHFPGGIIRSRLPYTSVGIERGTRLAGKSKMNFISLILHGMSAISVHLDTTAVRLLIASFGLICFSLTGIFVVSFIRLFISEWAFPNWATTLVTAFFIIIMQAFLISLLMLFTVLNYRTQKHFIPALDYQDFIEHVS